MDHTRILVVSSDREAAGTLARPLAEHGFHVRVALNGTDALDWLVQGTFQVVVLDQGLADTEPLQFAEVIHLKRLPVAIVLAARERDLPTLPDPLPGWIVGLVQIPGDPLTVTLEVQQALAEFDLRSQNRTLAVTARRSADLRGVITHGPRMDQIAQVVRRLTNLAMPVLITGEVGTGRQRIARALHVKGRPWVHVPCKALPEFLLDLELFGHSTNQLDFDGAKGLGAVEAARGGTLLLSDVEALPMRIQSKLIAWHAAMRKTPTAKPAKKNAGMDGKQVRLVATAGLELTERVARGSFKKELFELLSCETIEVPPLRDRSKKHLIRLIRLFEERMRLIGQARTAISRAELSRLVRRPWPGNLPELRQTVELLVRAAPGKPRPESNLRVLEPAANSFLNDFHPDEPLTVVINRVKRQVEKTYLVQVLAANGGRIDRSADHVGLSRKSMTIKMKQHGIDKSLFKGFALAVQTTSMPDRHPVACESDPDALISPSHARASRPASQSKQKAPKR